MVGDRRLVGRVPGSITDRLAAGKSWVLQPYVGFGAGQATLERQLGEQGTPSVLTIRGSWLEGLQAGRNLSPDEPRRGLGRTADALLYLGNAEALETAGPLPTLFRDRYVREIQRRHRLLYHARFDPSKAFPTSLCSAPVEDVGGSTQEPGGGEDEG